MLDNRSWYVSSPATSDGKDRSTGWFSLGLDVEIEISEAGASRLESVLRCEDQTVHT